MLVSAFLLMATTIPSSSISSDWPMYMHDAQHTGNNPGMPASFKPPLALRWVADARPSGRPGMWLGHPVACGGRVYLNGMWWRDRYQMGDYVLALDAGTGELRSSNFISSGPSWPPAGSYPFTAPLVVDGNLVWGIPFLTNGGLSALPLGFGNSTAPVFRCAGPSSPGAVKFSSPATAQGLIVAGETRQSGRYFAVGKDGGTRWSYQTNGNANMAPAISEEAGMVYAGSTDGVMHGIDLYSGIGRWTYLASGSLQAAASTDGVRVYLPCDGTLVALDARTGELVWAYAATGPMPSAAPALADGKVLWNTGDHVVALNAATGATVWSVETSIGGSSVVVGNGYVWGVGMGRLVCIRLSDGALMQDKPAPVVSSVSAIPVLVDEAGGELIVSTGGVSVAAFANSSLPLQPADVSAEAVEGGIQVRWGVSPPVPDDPAPAGVIVMIDGGIGGGSGGNTNGSSDPTYGPPNFYVNPGTGGVRPIDLEVCGDQDSSMEPSSVEYAVYIPGANKLGESLLSVFPPGGGSYTENRIDSHGVYDIKVYSFDVEGNMSPSARVSRVAVKSPPPITPRRVRQGGDWTESGCNSEKHGWNEEEMLGRSIGEPNRRVIKTTSFRKKFDYTYTTTGNRRTALKVVQTPSGFTLSGRDGQISVEPSNFIVSNAGGGSGGSSQPPNPFSVTPSGFTVTATLYEIGGGSPVVFQETFTFTGTTSGLILNKSGPMLSIVPETIGYLWMQDYYWPHSWRYVLSNVHMAVSCSTTAWGFGGRVLFSEPVVSRGTVYVCGSDERLYAINADTGMHRWIINIGGPASLPPLVQVNASPSPAGGEYVSGETLTILTDNGMKVVLRVPMDGGYPLSKVISSAGGIPLSPPSAGGSTAVDMLVRRPDGVILFNGVPLPGSPKNTSAFLGPITNAGRCVVVNGENGSKSRMVFPGCCEIDTPEVFPLNQDLVRPSGTPYFEGIPAIEKEELLVAGFPGGWQALIWDYRNGSLKWIPIMNSPQTALGKDGPIGGLVIAFATYKYDWDGWTGPRSSFSTVEAVSLGSFSYWKYLVRDSRRQQSHWEYDQLRYYPMPCPSDTYSIMDYSLNISSSLWDWPYFKQCGLADKPASPTRVNAVEWSPWDNGGEVMMSFKYLYGLRGDLSPAPNGNVGPQVAVARGQAFYSGDVVSGYGWSAPLVTVATTPPPDPQTGLVDYVNLRWTPAPGLTAAGEYEIMRSSYASSGGTYVSVGNVRGGDADHWRDDTRLLARDLPNIAYLIRARDSTFPQPLWNPEDDFAASIPARPVSISPDGVSITVTPSLITENQSALLIIKVTQNGALLPAVPVRVMLESVEGSVLKSSPSDNGVSGCCLDVITDQTGVARAIFVPGKFTAISSAKFTATLDLSFHRPQLESVARMDLIPSSMVDVGYPASSYFMGWPWTDSEIKGLISGGFSSFVEFMCIGTICSVPVNTLVGTIELSVDDLVLKSRGFDLGLRRTWSNFFLPNGRMGWGWTTTLDTRLERLANGDILLHRHTGSLSRFTKGQDGKYSPPAGSFDSLVEGADGTVTLKGVRGFTMRFDPDGLLRELRDRNGNTQSVEYSGALPVRISDKLGQAISLEYDSLGRVSTVADSAGRTVRYTYDPAGNLVGVSRPGGETATYEYNSKHLLTRFADPGMRSGSKREGFEYDDLNRIVKVFDGEGQEKHNLSYDWSVPGSFRTTTTSGCCGPRVDEYGPQGTLVAQVDALGHRKEFEFDENLRLTMRRDRNGHATHIQYDQKGNPVKVTNPLGGEMTMDWTTEFSMPSTFTDELGHATRRSYDGAGNNVSVTDALWNTTKKVFDGYGQLREVVDARGNSTRTEYDALSNVSSITDALGRTTIFEYDLRHLLTRRIDAKGRATSYTYDDRGRAVATNGADASITRTEYDEWNRPVRTIDALGNSTKSEYDRVDRLVSVTDARNAITRYTYNVQGNLLETTDANGNKAKYEYDQLNRMVKMTDALGKTQQYSYDAEGNRIERLDGNGARTIFTYDVLDRLLSRTFPDGMKEEFQYDAVGQVTMNRNPAAETRTAFDALGRVVESRDVKRGKVETRTYDPVGNLLSSSLSGETKTEYQYDPLNRQVSMHDSVKGKFETGYDEVGNMVIFSQPNGLALRYAYSLLDEVVSISREGEKGKASPAQVPNIQYGYDPVGNRTYMERSDQGRTDYGYDRTYQLTKVAFPSGDSQTFQFDPVGNRLKLLETRNKKLLTTLYEYNAGNEIVREKKDFVEEAPGPTIVSNDLFAGPGAPSKWHTTEYTFDGNGSRTQETNGKTRQYYWDNRERLLEVKDGNNIIQTNEYDPYNRRVSQTANGEKTYYVYDGGGINNRCIYEYPANGKGPATRHLWFAGRLVCSVTGDKGRYYMADALGSVVAVTDDSGAVVQRSFYEPFGKAIVQGSAGETSVGFVGTLGVRIDDATRLAGIWNRYYQAGNGLFIIRDPLRNYVLNASNRYLHPYTYTENRPVSYVDIDGLKTRAECNADFLNGKKDCERFYFYGSSEYWSCIHGNKMAYLNCLIEVAKGMGCKGWG